MRETRAGHTAAAVQTQQHAVLGRTLRHRPQAGCAIGIGFEVVDTTGVGCNAAPVASPVEGYLAMELEILLNAPNDGCGGRRPVDDVIDITYSALTVGGVSGVGDGIPAPADLHPETFPVLAEPH